jgi:hypothetical protein
MRPHVECRDKERKTFWEEIGCLPTVSPPADVAANLNLSVPQDAEVLRFASRTAGDGSLGRSRYVVVANWRGSRVVREAKALVPSAWEWAHGNISAKPWFADLAGGKYRSPDPFLHVRGNFIFRRIGPDFRKVELGEPGKLLEVKLLEAMGFDLGAIHAADALRASAVKNDLAKRRAGWLYAMAKVAALAVEQDYERWKR